MRTATVVNSVQVIANAMTKKMLSVVAFYWTMQALRGGIGGIAIRPLFTGTPYVAPGGVA
jgi:hypothetical protein